MEEYFPADRLLELEIGSVMQIDSENGDRSFCAKLVGVDKDRSVVNTVPKHQCLPLGADIREIFSAGKKFEMKTIHEGRIVAFESSMLGIHNDRLLISSFPEMIETRRLRRDIRFPCTLSCDIRSTAGDESYGAITDISHGGCRLTVKKNHDFTFIQQAINSGILLQMEVFFPIDDDPTVMSAFVKSAVCQSEGDCKVGLAFDKNYECVRKYLESLQLDSVAPFFR